MAKLLIVDDEDRIRSGIVTYIKLNSSIFDKIYTASDGKEALEQIFMHKPDVMLIDVQMPYKDGLEVMKEASWADICPKTIILSGYDDFHYAQLAIRYGAVDYLLKPCRPTEILEKLENMYLKDKVIGIEQSGNKGVEKENVMVSKAKAYINEHYMESISLGDVADYNGLSPAYLSTLFTRKFGVSFVDYLNNIRIEHACNYLKSGTLKAYEVSYKVGFNDEKYFAKVFKKVIGVSPSQYRRE